MTRRLDLINKHAFTKVILDKNLEIFVIYVIVLEVSIIYFFKACQVWLETTQQVALQWNKTPIEIFSKYTNVANMFSPNLTIELFKNTSINKHTIKLVKDKQPPYEFFYAFSLVELETLKAYIKTHLKTDFIRSFKSLAGVLILFDKKPNSSFHLCINY